ncbi:hypothetical protein ACFTZM_42885, partial [Streptomyces hydrogenans]
MTAFRQYFEDNPEIFAAIVAAIAILGGLLGSIIGAKIQARSGLDQAAAARDAAKTAAEAQHVATLWAVRHVQVAEFIRAVREAAQASERFYRETADSALREDVESVFRAMHLKHAEVELIAPSTVREGAEELVQCVTSIRRVAVQHGTTVVAHSVFRALLGSDDEHLAYLAEAAQGVLDEEDGDYQSRMEAFRAVPGLSPGQAHRLAIRASSADAHTRKNEASASLHRALLRFKSEARAMLKSEDDVAPAVP